MFIQTTPAPLKQWLKSHLVGSNAVFTEWEIIQAWRADRWLPPQTNGDQLSLFRTHFFVFHQLYWFDIQLKQQALGRLQITPLAITFLASTSPTTVSNFEIATANPLATYYLSWQPLFYTELAQVLQLLDFGAKRVSIDIEVEQALARFELCPPVTLQTVQQQFRRLAMRYHPDRGGNTAKLQAINRDRQLLILWLDHQQIQASVL